MRILLAQPRGFCAGVDRAIEIVERAIKMFGAPIHVRHEIVHNRYVVNDLREKGAIFVERVDEVPEGALLILSAHGVSKAVHKAAAQRHLHILDATCPLVAKVHMELLRHHSHGTQVILIGHAGHPEVQGALGQVPEGGVLLISDVSDIDHLDVADPTKLAYATQTTLSVDDTAAMVQALKQRFPDIQGPKRENICYATSNRQMAVKQLASACDVVLVIGSRNSSNSNRLKEVAERSGDCAAYLVDQAHDIDPAWLAGKEVIGITAGASAPEVLVQEVLAFLKTMGAETVKSLIATEEHVKFSLPEELKHVATLKHE